MSPTSPLDCCDCERPPDQDTVWNRTRQNNIFTFGDRDIGPTKLYICPVNPRDKRNSRYLSRLFKGSTPPRGVSSKHGFQSPYVQFNDDNMGKHDSWWHALKLRWILVNSKLFRWSHLAAQVPDPTQNRTVGKYSFFFPEKRRRLTLAMEVGHGPVHPSDIGFTKRVVDVYDFKYPVWFDATWEVDDTIGRMSTKEIMADDDVHWWNCVVDWEDMFPSTL